MRQLVLIGLFSVFCAFANVAQASGGDGGGNKQIRIVNNITVDGFFAIVLDCGSSCKTGDVTPMTKREYAGEGASKTMNFPPRYKITSATFCWKKRDADNNTSTYCPDTFNVDKSFNNYLVASPGQLDDLNHYDNYGIPPSLRAYSASKNMASNKAPIVLIVDKPK